jgi:hypothetical protein
MDEGALAHHGVLRLDARPECRRHGLAVLRQPWKESLIYIQNLPAVLTQGRELLQRQGRVSYRALKLRSQLDDNALLP